MNRLGNLNLGSVQSQSVNHESQASNSIGSTNPYSRRDSLSHEPNMEYSQTSSGFSRISAAATRAGRSFPGKSELQSSTSGDDLKQNEEESWRNQFVSTDLTLYTWNKSNTQGPNMDSRKSFGFSHNLVANQMKKISEKLQFSCDSDDSENTNIQNFIRTLQECTYSNNIELDKEDSSNQLESLKLTLALPIPKDNTHIQNENTSTSIERDQPKRSSLHQKESLETIHEEISDQDQASPNYAEVNRDVLHELDKVDPFVLYCRYLERDFMKEPDKWLREKEYKLQSDKNYSRRKIPHLRSVVQEEMEPFELDPWLPDRDQLKRSRLYQKESLETILEEIDDQDQVLPNYAEDNYLFYWEY